MGLPWSVTGAGLTLHVRVTPGGGADRIEGIDVRDDGAAVLRLRVSAPADKGRANAAALALVARALGLPKSAVTLVTGKTARFKTVAIAGEGTALAEDLATLTRAGVPPR
jgi:uncharacterized protein YggU (UPF0235/DUF167 family)